MMPWCASISAWARLPVMSACHRRLSKKTLAVYRLTNSLMGSENRADQASDFLSSWLVDMV
ncbi:hypothetical protein D9M68_938650 [compost metagenome]